MRRRGSRTARETIRAGIRVSLLAVVTLVAACTITQTGTPLPEYPAILPGVTTKLEVYQRYGLPQRISYSGDDKILIYDFKQGKGMGFGVGALGVWFRFNHVQNGTDMLTVRIGPDGRVVEARTSYTLRDTGFWFWPFGD